MPIPRTDPALTGKADAKTTVDRGFQVNLAAARYGFSHASVSSRQQWQKGDRRETGGFVVACTSANQDRIT